MTHRTSDALSEDHPCIWLWCPRHLNVADLPSKGTLDTSVLESQYWRHGPEFLTHSEEYWTTKTGDDFSALKEEVKIPTCLLVSKAKSTTSKDESILLPMAKKCSSLKKMIRVSAWILRLFHYKGAKKTGLDKEDLLAATKYWEEDAMKISRDRYKKGDYFALRAYIDPEGNVVCAGRIPSQALKIGYDKTELPILPASHVYPKLFIKDKHTEYGHPGIDKIVDMTRVWYFYSTLSQDSYKHMEILLPMQTS